LVSKVEINQFKLKIYVKTEAEKAKILIVIMRDEKLRQEEKERIRFILP
jgi:hypothetical protein